MPKKIRSAVFVRFPRSDGGSNHPYEVVWPLSEGIAATMLKRKGIDANIIDLRAKRGFDIDEVIKDVTNRGPVVLFIRYETVSLTNALCFSRKIKEEKKQVVIVGFGQHACALPEEIIKEKGADICITTDLECITEDLFCAIEDNKLGSISNIVYRDAKGKIVMTSRDKQGNYDIDDFPYIDLSLLSLGNYSKKKFPKPFFWSKNWGFIRTSLGCPYHCSFCSPLLRHSINKDYRLHSIEYIVEQIKYYRDKYGIKVFSMEDDIFSLDENRTRELCMRLAPLRIKWVVDGTRADKLPEQLLKEMKTAGCFGIGVGIESGSDRILNILQKGETVSQIRNASLYIRRLGFILVGYVIIGNPTETRQDLEATVKLVEEIKPHILYIHYFTPYPGSEVYNLYKEDIQLNNLSHYQFKGFNFSNINSKYLGNFMRSFYKRYYFSWGYLKEYFRRRLKYAVFDFNELFLITEAFTFIMSSRGGENGR